VICSNCGFQNAPGDEFCGSCGQFLAWTGEQSGGATGSTPAGGQPASTGAGDVTPGGAAASQATAGQQSVPLTWAASAQPPPTGGPPPPTGGPPPPTGGPPPPTGGPPLIRCPVCGTANEASRTFCLRCGSNLGQPIPGGRARQRTLLYIAGAAMIVIVLLGAGFVLLSGKPGAPSVAATSPPASAVAIGSSPAASHTATPSAAATESPPGSSTESSTPASSTPATPEPTASATASPTASATVAPPPAAGFSCADQHLEASVGGQWVVKSAAWSRKGPFDYLAIALEPGTDSTDVAAVDASLVALSDVSARYGVPPPPAGDVALVLSFNGAVTFDGPFHAEPGYRILKAFEVARGAGRQVDVVLGVVGDGCYNLSSEGLTSGSRNPTDLVVQVHK
jgi:predicted nucleic acid-binding Zn ribbon protein